MKAETEGPDTSERPDDLDACGGIPPQAKVRLPDDIQKLRKRTRRSRTEER